MSPVALTLDLMLAALLLITLIFGLRLDKRLRTLNATQAEFQAAVAELDQAAARAQAGLTDLRASMDEAVELLGGRLEKAREVAQRLEILTASAAARATQGAAAPAAAAAGRSPLDRALGSSSAGAPAQRRDVEPLTLTRRDAVSPARPAAPQQARSRAQVDDELFDRPQRVRLAGGR